MRLGRACQFIDLARSVGQQVGNAEPGHDVDRLRDPIAPDEGQKLLSRLDARWLGSTGPSIAPSSLETAAAGVRGLIPNWCTTADEDGHYSFAAALLCGGRPRAPAA